MDHALLTWPRRRLLIATALVPVVGAWLLLVSTVPLDGAPLDWLTLLALPSLLGALVLASYVPASGRRVEIGCSPCAVMAGLTLVGASLVVNAYPAQAVGPLLAAAITLYGLVQRLGDTQTCRVPGREPS